MDKTPLIRECDHLECDNVECEITNNTKKCRVCEVKITEYNTHPWGIQDNICCYCDTEERLNKIMKLLNNNLERYL